MQLGPDAIAGVSVGQILADRYRIDGVLGVGGMGVVVAARHIDLDEKVAIKFLLPEMLSDAAAVARFYREAKAASRIKSEHVARVFDVGRLPNSAPYMVMEFLEGTDLSGWLKQYGALPLAQAVDFILQTCIAVADAHALGIVHRDLKPANLFCVRRSDGQASIKVLDFGISKVLESDGGGVSFTQTHAMMGSPLYMSPEQFRSSKTVDSRTDIWALGTILYELVTGRAPFEATTVTELAIRIATEPALSPIQVRSDLPPGLAAVILKCLEKEPERRFQNVAELALALTPFALSGSRAAIDRVVGILGKQGLAASAAVPSLASSSARQAEPVPEGKTAAGVQVTKHPAGERKSGARWLVLSLGILTLGSLAAMLVWRARGATTESLPQAPATAAQPASATALPSSAPTTAALAEPIATAAPEPPSSARAPVEPAKAELQRPKPGAHGKAPRPISSPVASAAAPQPTPTPTPTPTPAHANCDPPFYFDAAGNRVFKQECL
jgi:serine/threonine-protein kinase